MPSKTKYRKITISNIENYMKDVLDTAMKQDFSSHVVLGRVLFGVSFLVLGLYSILNVGMLKSYAPGVVPDMLAPIGVLLVGGLFVAGGFGVASSMCVRRGSNVIALVWAVMMLTNVMSMYFDVREFFIALAFIGAALVIRDGVSDVLKAEKEEDLPNAPVEEERHHDQVPHEHR